MKAIVHRRYGPPEVVELREVEKPAMTADDLLVRVRAASPNPMDVHFVAGRPYPLRLLTGLRKPRRERVGADFAGTVEAVGGNVKAFRPGDEVFGVTRGAFAEYVCAPEARVVRKPAHLTFEQAAAVPVAALTALQGLRDAGRIQSGQRVLINGASGGVGTFAVQIAKSFGAEVTGVCSTRNVERVRSIGADRVVDYTREDFTRGDQPHDLMLDVAGNRSWSDCKRVLSPRAIFVVVGARQADGVWGLLIRLARLHLESLRGSRKVALCMTRVRREDLLVLKDLLEAGRVTPVIDRGYALSDASRALAYLGEGHARGKIAITVPPGPHA